MALTSGSITDTYHFLFNEMADSRTNSWTGVSSPLYPVGLSAIYLFLVLHWIPKFMQNRPPYKLKGLIITYNIYQLVACTLMIYGVLTSGWLTGYDSFCEPVDRSNSPEALRMASCCWWLYFIKFSEFIETIVFALRKKEAQISVLHLYHHVSTFLFAYVLVKYVPGGSYTFPCILNSGIHVAMYSYYLLALFKAPWLQKSLAKVKPYLTMAQMVQFVIIIAYIVQGTRPSCGICSRAIMYSFGPNVVVILYMFYDFYQKSYSPASTKKKT